MDHHPIATGTDARLNRRHFLRDVGLAALTTCALLREVRAADVVNDGRLRAKRWIDRQEELAKALRAGTMSQRQWHDEVTRVAADVDVTELMAEAARGLDSGAAMPFMRDPVKRNIHFVDADGRGRHFTYAAAVFSFGPENVITPHAHEHMASAHLVVEGKVRVRTFDRLAERGGALVIRPTSDHIGETGASAAMTTDKDNVHWFTPVTERAMTFDVIVAGLDPGQKSHTIQPVDPLGGLRMDDGSIIAPILTLEASMRRYTAHL